jgi:very-long-chain enoyl-CoA reductase
MKIAIQTRNGGAITSVTVADGATVQQLKEAIYREKRKLHPSRQRLTYDAKARTGRPTGEPAVLDDTKPLREYGISDGAAVVLKDLGPQLAFRTVYLVEYAGPCVLYALFALRLVPAWVYGAHPAPLNTAQQIAFFLWMVHFVKRQLETIFVHEFGTLTMPVFNVFKNSAYYWGFAALVGWVVNAPTQHELAGWHVAVGFPLFCVAMLCNFICHLKLMYLRPPGTNTVAMPTGFLFDYVTAPNYFCEIMTWVGFNVLTGFTWAGVLFNIVGAGQMLQWATDKHRKYKKQFKNYPKNRKILIPFIY